LVEARLTTTDESAAAACLAAIAQLVASAPFRVVGLLDISRVRVFGREDAELLVAVMREDNPRVERTAILINGEALFGMQMERLVRAAALPRRQVFRAAGPAIAWLAEILNREEVARARAFMAE
jgi:hypothetical protein